MSENIHFLYSKLVCKKFIKMFSYTFFPIYIHIYIYVDEFENISTMIIKILFYRLFPRLPTYEINFDIILIILF